MRRFFRLVPVALLLSAAPAGLALAFPGSGRPPATAVLTEADAGWRQDGNGPGRAGYQPVTPYLNPGAAARLDTVWTAPASRPEEQVGGAVIADGTLLRSAGGLYGGNTMQMLQTSPLTGIELFNEIHKASIEATQDMVEDFLREMEALPSN